MKFDLLFWQLMVWIDDHINHPLWDIFLPPYSDMWVDHLLYRFCQWSTLGLYDCEEKYEVQDGYFKIKE